MGPQSQQRIGNQTKRKCKLAGNNNPKKKKGQQTLFGANAFDAIKDCQVCKARHLRTFIEGYRVPNRAHHPLCARNTTTKGKGVLSDQQKLSLEDNKRYKALIAPITDTEKGSSRHLPSDRGQSYFAPRVKADMTVTTTTTIEGELVAEEKLSPGHFCNVASTLVSDASFAEKHKAKQAPLAMMAFAEEVYSKIVQRKKHSDYFNGICMEVPACAEQCDNPQCHSIVGQKLLLVDWQQTHGMEIPCPDACCQGMLQNDRTNWSKNKTLFPVFNLNGAPHWCVVQSMLCTKCPRRFGANEGEVLVNLPDYVADDYPVETTYAFRKNQCHLSRNTTDVFGSLMLTHGNGEMCSRPLHDCLNRSYVQRVKSHCSKAKENGKQVPNCIEKNGTHIKTFPPLGNTIRDMFDEASSSNTNPWRLSDYDRHAREMQAVQCQGIFSQDHTFEPIKNYQKNVGATAAWTCGTQTGEIAVVALVPSTKTEHFSHAAQQLTRRRPNFVQEFMHSDTWPHKEAYWAEMNIQGRLGLFHFEQRILRTLRKKHVDCSRATTDLLACLCVCYAPDYEKLLSALKEGRLSPKEKKHTSEDIAELQASKAFRERHAKYLRKVIHQPQTIAQNLDNWFCKHKVTSSDPVNKPAHGRLDPLRIMSLFTEETKSAVENCKEKAQHLSDPRPLEEMCDMILPNPNSKHQLTEFLSKRGESKLESFHDRLAHFANCGMRERLADNLNLAGTAKFNIAMRHKRLLLTDENPRNQKQLLEHRKKMPAAWEKIVPHFNHTELWYVNNLAMSIGCAHPFPKAEILPKDNGERFFSQCMATLKAIGNKQIVGGKCICRLCLGPSETPQPKPPPQKQTQQQTMSPPQQQQRDINIRASEITKPAPKSNERSPNGFTHRVGAPVIAQCQQHHNNVNLQIAPTPTQPILLPCWCFPPMFTSPTACCWKHKEWSMRARRVGRPPHDPLCSKR